MSSAFNIIKQIKYLLPDTGLYTVDIDQTNTEYKNFELFMVNFQNMWTSLLVILNSINLLPHIWDEIIEYYPDQSYQNFVKNLRENIKIDNSDPHALFRCYTAANILKTILHTPNNPNTDHISANLVNFSLPPFPDHIWVELYTRDRSKCYIFQSFYYGYSFSGKYGFYALEGQKLVEYQNLMNTYEMLSKELRKLFRAPVINQELASQWRRILEQCNYEFQSFTGVETKLHPRAFEHVNNFNFINNKHIPEIQRRPFNLSALHNPSGILLRIRILLEALHYYFKKNNMDDICIYPFQNNPYRLYDCEYNVSHSNIIEPKFTGVERVTKGCDMLTDQKQCETSPHCVWSQKYDICVSDLAEWKLDENNLRYTQLNYATGNYVALCRNAILTLNHLNMYERQQFENYKQYAIIFRYKDEYEDMYENYTEAPPRQLTEYEQRYKNYLLYNN